MKKNLFTRRGWLSVVALGCGGIVGLFGAYKWWKHNPRPLSEEQIEDLLQAKLYWLQLDPEGVKKFAKDCVKNRYNVWDDVRMLSNYMLSTDFFLNGSDESKPVKYLSFYDPFDGFCSNPFARYD